MVGNDVVDLEERRGREDAGTFRFDRRVFDEHEQRVIAASGDPHRTRWSLWAAKEAAYKAAKRMDESVVWSPVRFRVRLGPNPDQGRVTHESGIHAVRFLSAESGVHALAVAEELSSFLGSAGRSGAELIFGCRRGRIDDPSAEVRRLAREGVAPSLGASADEIEVRRRARIPEIWCRGVAAPAPLSLSHHGELVAWACWVGSPEGAA